MRRILDVIKITGKLCKMYYVVVIAQAVVRTARVLVGVYGLKLIIDGLLEKDVNTTLITAFSVLGIEFILGVLDKRVFTYHDYYREVLKSRLHHQLSYKMMNIEYYHLEDSKYLDLAERSTYAIEHFGALRDFFDSLAQLVYQTILVISLITILISFKPLIIVIIFVSLVFHFITNALQSKKRVKLVGELGPINRRYGYFSNALEDPKFAKDYRLYPLSNLIFNKYINFVEKTEKVFRKYYLAMVPFAMLFVFVSAIQVALVYVYIGYVVVTASLGVSTFVYLSTASKKTADAFSSVIDNFFSVNRCAQMLEPLVELSKVPSSKEKYSEGLVPEEFSELRFENVTFKYPNSDETVLENVTFTISKGEKVSIVGINGAGKTTIIKLLCRFFKPTSGTIYWNNVDINNYKYSEYLKQIAAVFQDFKIFALTVKENIDMENGFDDEVIDVLNKVSMSEKLNKLDDGIHTYISKEYHENGTELSGGELQKIAIARAMYKKGSLQILDEPTSALDPLAEAEIYENFSTLIEDKTAIFISHRMSSSVFCDKIIVLDNKTVQDIDNHEALMSKKHTKYSELFSAQAEYYSL